MAESNEKIIVRVDAELAEIVPRFLENRRKDVQSILKGLVEGDYEAIRVLGHSMKGSGGGFGFDAISEIGQSLEQAARNQDSEEIRKWVNELSTYLERVEVVYE